MQTLVAVLLGGFAVAAPAQTILQETFDTAGTPNGGNVLAWQGGTLANTTPTNGLPSGGDTTTFTDTSLPPGDSAYYRISWP